MPMLIQSYDEFEECVWENFLDYISDEEEDVTEEEDLSDELLSQCQPLVEIYSVEIENKSANLSNFYGTIKVEDYFEDHPHLFNLDSNNPLKCRPNVKEIVKLVGPAKPINAYDAFEIEFNIMDGDDNKVMNDLMYWTCHELVSRYDEPLLCEISSVGATAYVHFAVFATAKAAKVEVTLIHGIGDKVKATGTLSAFTSLVDKRIPLLHEDKEGTLYVRSQERIPLSRSLVIVDVWSVLTIQANLKVEGSSHQYFNVEGKLKFPARCTHDEVTQNIEVSPYGQLVVKVTWLSE